MIINLIFVPIFPECIIHWATPIQIADISSQYWACVTMLIDIFSLSHLYHQYFLSYGFWRSWLPRGFNWLWLNDSHSRYTLDPEIETVMKIFSIYIHIIYVCLFYYISYSLDFLLNINHHIALNNSDWPWYPHLYHE